ncbi:MAG: NAD-dependent succinate-semialdehyde dehydrogenase [Pseudomonadota bacterium]
MHHPEYSRHRFDTLRMLIAGEWTCGTSAVSEDVFDPATGEPLGRLPHASRADLARAVEAADSSFPRWSRTPAIERCRILLKAARLVRERIEAIALVLTLEQGKPLAESRGEVAAAAEIFEWYAEESRRLYGRIIPSRQMHTRHTVTREAIGPVAAFTPWNFPALTPARKMAGALAAGCTCVIKPSEETPATAIELARACVDAGLPAGVLNVVFGVPAEVSEFLIAAPQIRKITFTGSTAVGKRLAAMAALNGAKRCTMELGGHAPVLVFDDADVEAAARACAASRFRNAGQVCVAASRFFVQRKAYARFVDCFVGVAQGIAVGSGLEASTGMGPLANTRRLDAMEVFMQDSAHAGGRVATGGARAEGPGSFWPPTVLLDLPDDARAMREETFGPIAPIVPFDSVDDALARANRVPFGLAAYAFTASAATVAAVSDGLQSGMIGINTLGISLAEAPFGGVKESGYGSEGGTEGLDAYLSTKFIAHMA